MTKVLIDFQGGTHGHFLESVLNGLDSESDELINDSPFRMSDHGTCRNKIYPPWSLRFCSDHFYETERLKKHQAMIDSAEHCISIKLQPDHRDILLYLRVALARSLPPEWPQPGPFDQLHVDFYHKTSSTKMLGWRRYLDLAGIEISQQQPNIEICVLRNLLKDYILSFDGPLCKHFETRIPYYQNKTQHVFMFSWFYNPEQFLNGLAGLSAQFDLKFAQRKSRVQELHQEFLRLNGFANDRSYQRCQAVIDNLESKNKMPDLDVLDQAWILNQLELLSGKKISYNNNDFFTTPYELHQYIMSL
jgi:hypothetical protein